MKKTIAFLMALTMILCLCACAAQEETPAAEAAAPATESDAQAAPVEADSSSNVVVATSAPASSLDKEKYAVAEACIGQDVAELFDALGEPDSSEYTSSCLVENAKDGVLYYNSYGFYVFSLLESDGTETVQAILELE